MVVDKFSKYAHFIPLTHPFTALDIALVYMDQVYKLHGLPKAIVSDRDRIFTSSVWQELFRLTKTELRMSTAYHPKPMDKHNELTSVWKDIFAALFILALISGKHGCH